jgi:hypothetical protein
MVLATVLDLKFVCRKSWITVTLPDRINESPSLSGSAGVSLKTGCVGCHGHVGIEAVMRII